jgi:hypothetical protein
MRESKLEEYSHYEKCLCHCGICRQRKSFKFNVLESEIFNHYLYMIYVEEKIE